MSWVLIGWNSEQDFFTHAQKNLITQRSCLLAKTMSPDQARLILSQVQDLEIPHAVCTMYGSPEDMALLSDLPVYLRPLESRTDSVSPATSMRLSPRSTDTGRSRELSPRFTGNYGHEHDESTPMPNIHASASAPITQRAPEARTAGSTVRSTVRVPASSIVGLGSRNMMDFMAELEEVCMNWSSCLSST